MKATVATIVLVAFTASMVPGAAFATRRNIMNPDGPDALYAKRRSPAAQPVAAEKPMPMKSHRNRVAQ